MTTKNPVGLCIPSHWFSPWRKPRFSSSRWHSKLSHAALKRQLKNLSSYLNIFQNFLQIFGSSNLPCIHSSLMSLKYDLYNYLIFLGSHIKNVSLLKIISSYLEMKESIDLHFNLNTKKKSNCSFPKIWWTSIV